MNNIEILEYGSQRCTPISLGTKLLQQKIIFINDIFDYETVANWQTQLIYLSSISKPGDIIQIYINSPGGDVYSCLGLYDLMQKIISQGIKIQTINVGLAASASAIILMSGSKGLRESLAHGTVLVHQPSSGSFGTITDIQIDCIEGNRLKQQINEIVEKHASKDLIPLMERDKYLTIEEAIQYNVIDTVK